MRSSYIIWVILDPVASVLEDTWRWEKPKGEDGMYENGGRAGAIPLGS